MVNDVWRKGSEKLSVILAERARWQESDRELSDNQLPNFFGAVNNRTVRYVCSLRRIKKRESFSSYLYVSANNLRINYRAVESGSSWGFFPGRHETGRKQFFWIRSKTFYQKIINQTSSTSKLRSRTIIKIDSKESDLMKTRRIYGAAMFVVSTLIDRHTIQARERRDNCENYISSRPLCCPCFVSPHKTCN